MKETLVIGLAVVAAYMLWKHNEKLEKQIVDLKAKKTNPLSKCKCVGGQCSCTSKIVDRPYVAPAGAEYFAKTFNTDWETALGVSPHHTL